jgi:hypothetical protein
MEQTAQEIHAVAIEWIHKHCPVALKTAETGGLTNEDSILIGQFIEQHYSGEWSVPALNDAVDKLRDQLTFRSKADLEYQAAWESLNPEQQSMFANWWDRRAAQYVQKQGEEGFINASRIITWSKQRTFSPDVFDRAVQNLFATQGLYPAPTRQQGEKRGHSDDGRGFMSREDTNVSAADRARHERARQEANQPKSETSPSDPNSAEWKRKADALTGTTHSDNAILARLSGPTHYETYQMRQRYLNSKQRANFSKTAV